MEIIITGRQAGKTTTVLSHLYAFDDSVLVVPTNQRANQLKREHPDVADRIVSATTGLRDYGYERVLVDDVDMVLHHLIGAPITLATATGDPVEVAKEEEDWWLQVADVASQTYNRVADNVEGVNVDISEQLASDVARHVADWYVSEIIHPED